MFITKCPDEETGVDSQANKACDFDTGNNISWTSGILVSNRNNN